MTQNIEREIEIDCAGGGRLRFYREAGAESPVQVWITDPQANNSMAVAIPVCQLILATLTVCEDQP